MQLALYIIGTEVIIPTTSRTKAGYYLGTGPVTRIDIAAPTLPDALREALDRGNPEIPTPSRTNFPEPVILKYANAKSWRSLTKIADRWELTRQDESYVLARADADSDGVYSGGRRKFVISMDASRRQPDVNAIVEAIRADTQGRQVRRGGQLGTP